MESLENFTAFSAFQERGHLKDQAKTTPKNAIYGNQIPGYF